MLRVIGCITDQHDPSLVLLAIVVCALSCYTAFSLLARTRSLATWSGCGWLAAAAFVTGSGVWATHFIAELAYRPGLPIAYDIGLTLFSMIIAVVVSGLGFALALTTRNAALGGMLVGVAIGAMHYTGMMALRLPAVAHWDFRYVAASIVISIGVGSLALWAGSRRRDIFGHLLGGGLLVLAIAGLHFTAMSAVSFTPDPTIIIPKQAIAPEWLAVAIAAMTVMIVGLGLAGSAFDWHLTQRTMLEAERLRRHVAELESTKRSLEDTTSQLTNALELAAAASDVKSHFLATMSHELRTPLNAIIGFSEILKTQTFGPIGNSRYCEYHEHIYDSGTHLLSLINDILDMSKLAAGQLELHEEWVDLNGAIAQCVHLVTPQAKKNLATISVNPAEGITHVRADARRLRQILLNLLSNAVKFAPNGEIRISTRLTAEGLAVSVSDNGIGMAPGQIPQALTLFGQIDSTLARRQEGTGLGLPLTKHLVELHGGTLEIRSGLAKGTTATLLFPLGRVGVWEFEPAQRRVA